MKRVLIKTGSIDPHLPGLGLSLSLTMIDVFTYYYFIKIIGKKVRKHLCELLLIFYQVSREKSQQCFDCQQTKLFALQQYDRLV